MAEQTQSLAELQAEYEAKIAKALANAKTRLKTELDLVLLTAESLVKAGETALWNDANVAPILKSLGLQAAAAAASPKRGRPAKVASPAPAPAKVSVKAPKTRKGKRGKQGETILAALGKEKLATGDIARKISYTGANLSAVLAGMRKAHKIDKLKDGRWFSVV